MASFQSVVIDVNACFRNMIAPGGICQLTPRAAVGIFFSNYVKRYSNARVVVFAFDSPHLVPEERLHFHRTKRYAKASRPVSGTNEVLAGTGAFIEEGLSPLKTVMLRC